MLERMLKIRIFLGAALSNPGMPNNLNGNQWDLVNLYVQILAPFKHATEIMSGVNHILQYQITFQLLIC